MDQYKFDTIELKISERVQKKKEEEKLLLMTGYKTTDVFFMPLDLNNPKF